MPGKNGTGPAGAGPMTGRGLGPCVGGQSAGMRGGRGRGFWRNGNSGGMLRNHAETAGLSALRDEIDSLRRQVEKLTGEKQ